MSDAIIEVDLVRVPSLEILHPGAHFGLVSLLTEGPAAATIKAREDSKLIIITRDTFNDLFGGSPSFSKAVCRSLAWFLRENISSIPAIPFARIDSFPKAAETATLLPARISRYFRAIAVDQDDDRVKVALVNPTDERACEFIKSVLTKHNVEFVAIAEHDFERNQKRLLGDDLTSPIQERDEAFETLAFVDNAGKQTQIMDSGHDAVLRHAIGTAISSGASDIHIEPAGVGGRIRLRLDGKLMTFTEDIQPNVLKQIVGQLKVMANLDITMTHTSQDGSFVVVSDDRYAEIRLSVMPCRGGEKVVLRLGTHNRYLAQLSNLFVSEAVFALAKDLFIQPSGLVLVTGPTGSGKTTTLYAALNMLNNEYPNSGIVTIEDPIEYELPYATQIQIDPNRGFGFPEALRSVLRQDPDILMIGEIRDRASAAIAVEAATSGHLVLSSMHTHTAMETLARLRNFQVPPYLLADALRGVVSQTLVPRLHPGYTETLSSDDPVVSRLIKRGVLEDSHLGKCLIGVSSGDGPTDGEQGRIGLFEFLAIDGQLRDAIDRAATRREVEQTLGPDIYFPFSKYGRLLLETGSVTPERIERALPRHVEFGDF